ncbi:phenylalanyl-tRNA synthetase, mitochondrial isoform X2 [Amblyomma americanum]
MQGMLHRLNSTAGVRVLTDVDARRLHEHPWVLSRCAELSEIVFNFPHVGGKMKIGENRRLLRDFFISAGLVLRLGSCVRLTLCRGQGGTPADSLVRPRADTWQVVDMAAPGGFVLRSVEPFCPPAGYTPRGYRGGAKGFHTKGALTHVFCLVGSAVAALPSAASLQADQHLMASRLRSLMGTPGNPLGRTVHRLASVLGVDSSCIITSWASGDYESMAAAHWRSHVVNLLLGCSPVQPPFGHIVDVTLDMPGRAATILQDVGDGGTFLCSSLTPATVSWDNADGASWMAATTSWRIYCRRLHVATLWCSSGGKPQRAEACNGSDCKGAPFSSDPLNISEDTSSFEKSGFSLITTMETIDFSSDTADLLEGKLSEKDSSESSSVANFAHSHLSIHVELLSLASSCLDDWRHLLYERGQESGPMYPGTVYTHDLSLWLDEGYDEKVLLRLIHNAAGELLQSIRLVDDYRDPNTGRKSRCYRLLYQSLWKALSREAARDFHLALGAALGDLLPVRVR